MLGQSELTILVDPRLPSKIYQGITTEITGEGNSVAPVNDAMLAADHAEYEHLPHHAGLANVARVFCAARKAGDGDQSGDAMWARPRCGGWCWAMRMCSRRRQQLTQMKELVADAMRDGAVGLSTALQYAPAPYAKTEELIALAAWRRKYGGIYATHMRSEGDAVLESIDEAARIGREATYSGGDLAPEGRGQSELGQDAADCGADRCGARGGCGHQREHLRLYRVVQHVFGFHSAVGARWRRCEACGAVEGSGHAGADSQRYDDGGKGFGRRGLGTTSGRRFRDRRRF